MLKDKKNYYYSTIYTYLVRFDLFFINNWEEPSTWVTKETTQSDIINSTVFTNLFKNITNLGQFQKKN